MIAFLAFILIVPGFLLSIVNIGLNESSLFQSMNFGKTVYDSVRVWALRIAYMIVPAAVFLIALSTMGKSSSLGIVILLLESIGNYSLGLLYANIADNERGLVKFEKGF